MSKCEKPVGKVLVDSSSGRGRQWATAICTRQRDHEGDCFQRNPEVAVVPKSKFQRKVVLTVHNLEG